MPNTEPIFTEAPKRRSSGLWILSLIVGLLILGAFIFLSASKAGSDEYRIKNVSSAVVETKTIRDLVSVSGLLELSKKDIIVSPGSGVVEQVLVTEGSSVQTGDILVRIETKDLEAQLESKLLSLEKLIRNAEQDDAEQRYTQRKAAIDIASAERALEDAQAKLNSVEALRGRKLVSEEELRNAERSLQSAQDALEQNRIASEQKETLYQLGLKNTATDRIILETEIVELRDKIADYTVCSRNAGIVYSLSVEAGGTVSPYEELAVIADPVNCQAALDVPETRIASVSVGLPVSIYVGSASYPAVVSTVAPSASSSSSSSGAVVRVVAAFQTKPEKPTIGSSISGEIIVGTLQDALVLPRGPYLSSGNYASAYVVEGTVATKQSVKYGIADGSYIQVLSGLKKGDRVLVSDYRDFIHLDSAVLEKSVE